MPLPARRPAATRRLLAGSLVAVAGLVGLTLVLRGLPVGISLSSVVLLYLVVVVVTAVVGGLAVSLATAVVSDLVVNFYFIPPYHTLSVESRDHVITLIAYVAVAATVSLAVDVAARQRAAAARTGIEAELLARISAEPVGQGSTQTLLDHVRASLHMDTAALLDDDGTVVAAVGGQVGGNRVLSVAAGQGLTLIVEGPPIFAPDPRFLARLAAAAARTHQAEQLALQAAHATELAEIDRLRAALLAAVGHDLRTPLAGIKAGVSGLRDPDLDLAPAEQAELLETIEESADKMADLVENLLALSRLQAGALSVHARPVALDEIVAAALMHQAEPVAVDLDVPDDLPLAYADPGLLERVVANVLANAHQVAPEGVPVQVIGRRADRKLQLRIADRGPGVPAADRERMFVPFQRLDDRSARGGLGLGLAIARGFTEAMGGTIVAAETPGGGLTMIITLPAAP
ncbi:sensor histidine kinase [Hamadaea tsunoensis]|uniref:sensor histidine kinase n=1 Tax=Hamadaea tsunoensis TaxID=53368 RepID=UPI00041CD6A3|nr:ATP-binding protein [Hamadaea tsunoensis]